MNKLLFPSFKLSKPKRSRFWLMEDKANSGPRYLLSKNDLIYIRGQIENLLGNFIKGGKSEGD